MSRGNIRLHLKAIFPFDPRGAYGVMGSFREEYPGGVLHLFRYLVMHFAAMHRDRGQARRHCRRSGRRCWQEAMENPDYRMYPHIYNVLTQKGQHMPPYFRAPGRSLRQGGGGRRTRSRA